MTIPIAKFGRWVKGLGPKAYMLAAGFVVGLGLLAALAWFALALRPVNGANHLPVSVVVNPGDGSRTIATHLLEQHLIRDRTAFLIYLTKRGLVSRLKSGYYLFSQADSARLIAVAIAGGKSNEHSLVVPEGTTLAQIERLMVQQGLNQDQVDLALHTSYSYDFLQGRPTDSLEGYLFPDTYTLNPGISPTQAVMAMLNVFQRKVTPSIIDGFARQGLDLNQGLTLASIVEREVASPTDRQMVAQVFLKRLQMGLPLESDVTVEYAANLTGRGFSTQLNSPYNTYLQAGLPPGPICNPGLEAMEAVINPARTDYLYFVSDSHGHTYFAHTLAEHERNIQKAAK